MDNTLRVDTEIIDGDIHQRTTGPAIRDLATRVIQMQDQQIHDALVKLGWTPPNAPQDEATSIIERLIECISYYRNLDAVPPTDNFPEVDARAFLKQPGTRTDG